MNLYIDHTLLKPDVTETEINKLCEEAKEYNFASVCVAPTFVKQATELYPIVATVIGFPHGNIPYDTKWHLINSIYAQELDVVINIGAVKSSRWDLIDKEINWVSSVSGSGRIVKYIVEVGYLTDEELFKIADMLIKWRVAFIKTCTGYGPRGVTVEDIIKIKKYVGNSIKIKASGGIKTLEQARRLIDAGADRIGTSSSVSIMKELSK